jgi:TPP-dependent 2-oxoacid decarboxylase
MSRRPLTPAYVVFYVLFSPDTWRILIGIGLAFFLAPQIIQSREISPAGQVMVWGMIITIGWAVFAILGKKIAAFFKRLVLGKNGK